MLENKIEIDLFRSLINKYLEQYNYYLGILIYKQLNRKKSTSFFKFNHHN
jgi:hypothetical protein